MPEIFSKEMLLALAIASQQKASTQRGGSLKIVCNDTVEGFNRESYQCHFMLPFLIDTFINKYNHDTYIMHIVTEDTISATDD